MITAGTIHYDLTPPRQTEELAVESLYTMAYQLFEGGRYDEALKLFRLVMQLRPEDERGWLGAGVCHESLGQWHIAVNMYAAAIVTTGKSVRCALSYHRVLKQLGKDEQAEQALERALQWAEQGDDEQDLRLVRQLLGSQGGEEAS